MPYLRGHRIDEELLAKKRLLKKSHSLSKDGKIWDTLHYACLFPVALVTTTRISAITHGNFKSLAENKPSLTFQPEVPTCRR